MFYDGPPFANGLPHYGHLLTGFVKDAVPRYRTMRGQVVYRRFGWDCHGLPAEVEAEKELGIAGHPAITAFGIDKFNDACRTSVLRYTDEWQRYVDRQARWVDFDNDYKTLDLDYMESVMWAFKTLWDEGLIYEGFRVLAYCWRCETPLSNTETRMDDVYHDRQDPALTVGFELLEDSAGPGGSACWRGRRRRGHCRPTSPSPSAPDIDYAVVERDGRRYVLAESRLEAYAGASSRDARPVGPIRGTDLVGRRYRPLFAYFAEPPARHRHAFQVLGGRLRVDRGRHRHRPPGARFRRGRPDRLQRRRHPDDLPDGRARPVHRRGCAVGGRCTSSTPTPHVIRAAQGARRRRCATRPTTTRTRTAGAARSRSSTGPSPRWFVQVTKFRDRMVELNQQITWVPEHVKHGSFGKWLENARDWSISRNRFWGSPIPVWRSDDPDYPRVDVYGSIADLERDFGVAVDRSAPPDGRRARAAEPRRSDGPFDDAARPRGARLLVRVRVDAVRPGPLPVREPRVVRGPLPGRLHRRVHRPDAGAGSTRCTCWPPRCSTGRRSAPASATASCSATTG